MVSELVDDRLGTRETHTAQNEDDIVVDDFDVLDRQHRRRYQQKRVEHLRRAELRLDAGRYDDALAMADLVRRRQVVRMEPLADSEALSVLDETDDIARTVRFLVEDAPYITGQVLAVDGGFDASGVGLPTLRDILASGTWQQPQFAAPKTVT